MMMHRRSFLGCVSIAALIIATPANAWIHGGHIDDVIPVSSLSAGGFSANAFSGFTSPTTTVHASGGFNLLSPNPDNALAAVTSNYVVRDSQCSTYFGRGSIILRLNGSPGSQTCFYFDYNSQASTGGDIRVGIRTGYDSTAAYPNGTNYAYYVNADVATSAEGIAAGFTNSYSSGDHFTFGVQGFTVFLQWNGIDLIRYTEWRLMAPGKCAVLPAIAWGARDITVHYPAQNFLFSNPGSQIYDPRDFGMRAVAAVTGSMSAGSNQLVLSSNPGFVVGDSVIVELGGEAGAGVRGTVGVGGQWPFLSYADLTALNADTSKPDGTFAFILTNNFVYSSTGGVWQRFTDGSAPYNQGYYTDLIVPMSLVATVTAVSGSTLTLSHTATVATTAANVWLDCTPSFYLINQVPLLTATMAPNPANVTLSIPAGNWRLSGPVLSSAAITLASGFTVTGASRTTTKLFTPKGISGGAIQLTTPANNTTIKNLSYTGNNGDNGFLFKIGGTTTSSFSFRDSITLIAGGATTGLVLQNLDCTDSFGQAMSITGGTNPLIDNCTTTMTSGQFQYMGWQMQLSNATGGTIQNCTATGAFLLKSFEFFACNGASIVNCGGQNVLYSTNSSTNWTIDCRGLTVNYLTNCFFNTLSGSTNEGLFNVNDNAFGTGATGTIFLGRHIQQGYVDASSNSIPFITIATQTDVTVTGSYPGAGGCSTSLDGLLVAPDYNAGSGQQGSMFYSDTARTVVSGVRIKGTAIGSPGHSGHFGNISLTGASSSVTNCVADVIQTGPTLSGNQTNTAYGGC